MEKIKKAKFKGDIEMLKNAQCILMGISMKQTHQSGEELNAFVHGINHYPNIKKVILVITDYLHRHYVQLEGHNSLEDSGEEAEKMGEAWMECNKSILEELSTVVEVQIIKWRDLIEDSNQTSEDIPYSNCLSTVQRCYSQDFYFQQIVDVYSEKFGKKYYDRLTESRENTLEACILAAKNYCLEEIANSLKFISLKFDVMTYPGDCNQGISFIYNRCIRKPLNFIPYRFRSGGKENKFFPTTIKKEQEETFNEIYQLRTNI
jgi:hypothetical protein